VDECKPLPTVAITTMFLEVVTTARLQGLTLVHFSAQLEPCLTHKPPLCTLNNHKHPLNTGYTTPTRNPCPIQSAQVELKSGRV